MMYTPNHKFNHQRLLIHFLQKPRTQNPLYLNSSPNNLPRKLIHILPQTSYLRVLCAWSGSYSSHNPLAFECVKFFLSWIKFLLFSFLTFNPTLITNKDYKPCLVVEFPSTYHDSHDARELDNKKLHLLTLAGVPLIYSRIKDFGLLHLYSQNEEVIFNLFTGEKRENAKALIKNYCEPSNFANVLAIA